MLAAPALLLATRTGAAERDGVEQAAAAWLAAFNDLDLPRFLTFFAADASLFMPGPGQAGGRRVDPAQLPATWTAEFAKLRARSAKSSPPYLTIAPRDLRVDRVADGAALLTFHLGEGAWPGRRSVLWRRDAQGWRIAHLHASRLADPAGERR
ncbi:YybH family protein [Sphingomonas lenta]|uniref:YybH family protein n=1 Tax=Sphingomonas lenta TaxID=1141887 RepID=UPI001595B537|nr:nuclear transport factor 2 family protein [Sphingomonas lenta]